MLNEGRVKASVITICRNESASIRATIESVLCQTFRDFEYIVIDGASTDGTADIISSYSERLAYWVSEPDSGIYEAMNKGIRRASGEYMLFLNGGDLLESVETLAKVFAAGHDEDILYGDTYKSDGARRYRCSFASYSMSPFFLFTHTLPHQGSFIRKRLFEELGLYDATYRLMGDYEFFKRAIIKGGASTRYLGFPVCIFDLGGISTRPEYKPLQQREARRARKEIYGPLIYCLYSAAWGIYDLFIYRPRRKLRKLLEKT